MAVVNIAIIPARGGSKRIPRKNLRPFHGRPMIEWPIEAAQSSGCFDDIIVSTDDEEIAAIAEKAGARAPFRRPRELSDDHTPTLPVIAHALEQLVALGLAAEYACCIYPTAPFLQSGDLVRAFALLREKHANYVFSATTFAFPVQRALRLDTAGFAIPAFPESIGSRSQDLPEMFHDAGQFYWGSARAFREQRPIFAPGSLPLMLPRSRVQDIDTPEDWRTAELLFRVYKETSS